MSPEYEIKHQDREYKVEVDQLDEGGLLIVKIGEESFTLKPNQNEDGSWTVNDTISDHVISVVKRSGKTVTLEVDGAEQEIEWSRVRKETIVASSPTKAAGGPRVKGGVYPPMPGKITEVMVKVGDTVKAGQTVCILEAMKMFNELNSPSDGTVKVVNVQAGSSVTVDDILVLVE